jgi:tetratricopeptide (TPR) repeat protein
MYASAYELVMENIGKVQIARRLCDSGRFKEALQSFKELERDSEDPSQKAGYVLDEATCYAHDGDSEEAQECISKARMLVRSAGFGTD